MTAEIPMIICDPRPEVRVGDVDAAPRLRSLEGVSFALVHNGKTHGMELMYHVLEELGARWHLGEVVEIGPPSPGYGGNPDDAGLAPEAVMAALSAVGD
jgi:hypothetical protein